MNDSDNAHVKFALCHRLSIEQQAIFTLLPFCIANTIVQNQASQKYKDVYKNNYFSVNNNCEMYFLSRLQASQEDLHLFHIFNPFYSVMRLVHICEVTTPMFLIDF